MNPSSKGPEGWNVPVPPAGRVSYVQNRKTGKKDRGAKAPFLIWYAG
jgi:hypothetical protein